MSKVWEKFDMEIAATPMPEPYQNKMVTLSLSLSLSLSYTHTHTQKKKLYASAMQIYRVDTSINTRA